MSYNLASSTWDEKELLAMQEVISEGHFTMGPKVKRFEEQFAQHFGSKFAVMSNSGSSANLLAVAAMRYRKNSNASKIDVIVPAVSWSTTYYPVSQMGFRLKFVDVDVETLNATTEAILGAIDENTAGIFAVNLLGNPSDLSTLRREADERGIFLIEDNCESMGAEINGKQAGTFGHVGTFSTFFSHHISTMEGGVCLTDDEELAQVMTSLRAHGWTRELPQMNHVHNKTGDSFDDSFRFVLPGYNLRPLELSGAIGIEQLKKLPGLVEQRRLNAVRFSEFSRDWSNVLTQKEFGKSSWFGFSMVLGGDLAGRRRELIQLFEKNGIQTRPIVAGNFTKNPVLKHLNHVPFGALNGADTIHSSGLFVGNHHYPLVSELTLLNTLMESFTQS